MSWSPINNTTHYSCCLGLTKPEQLLKKCVEYGYKSCAIADNNTLGGSVDFFSEAKKLGIKPILGSKLNGVILLAKNLQGWKNLLKVTNNDNLFDYQEDGSLIAIAPDSLSESESYHQLQGKFGKDLHTYSKCGIQEKCYYLDKSDVEDYKVLMSADSGKVISSLSDIPDAALFNAEQSAHLDNSWLTEQCEEYDILGQLNLPRFDIPKEFDNQYDYLVHLCRQGWKSKIAGKGLDEKVYAERVKKEFEVFKRVGLEGYLLIVADYVNWAKNQGWLVGPGRGSSSGSLTCYLLNITDIDPIKYNLIFERFYNDGRNTKDRKAFPDIDTDFPKFKRELVIEYIKQKYGYDKVCGIVTYSELKGKSSIKEVLRAHKACSSDEMNKITKDIPAKEKISDLLADANENSIIRWTLQNEPDILKEWVTIDEQGNIQGNLSRFFEQAIRIEGTFIGTGKHASGIIVASDVLNESCPMIKDKHGEALAALDMSALEKAGFLKFDILGLAGLDKLMGINNLLMYGRINV